MFDVQSLLRYTKLSQRELGRILGVSESAITKAKQGKMNWPDEWTAILSKKLNLDLSRFELDDLNMANEPYTTYNKSLIQRIEGKFCVVLFSKKTQTKSVIPIFPDAKNVLDKYSDNLPKRPSGQKFNDMVKEVCRLSGITQQVQISKLQGAGKKILSIPKYEAISSHTARRSFITIMSIMGLTPKEISMMTGHSQTRIVEIYDKTKAEQNAVKVLENLKDKLKL